MHVGVRKVNTGLGAGSRPLTSGHAGGFANSVPAGLVWEWAAHPLPRKPLEDVKQESGKRA